MSSAAGAADRRLGALDPCTFPPAEPTMTERAVRPATRGAAGAVVVALVVLAGLVAPAVGATRGGVRGRPAAGRRWTTAPAPPARKLTVDAKAYLAQHGAAEHAWPSGWSVSLPDPPGRASSCSAGTTTLGGGRAGDTQRRLWQIENNTKAFTSVLGC